MRAIFFTTVFVFMVASQVMAQNAVREVIANADKGYYIKDSVLYDGIFLIMKTEWNGLKDYQSLNNYDMKP